MQPMINFACKQSINSSWILYTFDSCLVREAISNSLGTFDMKRPRKVLDLLSWTIHEGHFKNCLILTSYQSHFMNVHEFCTIHYWILEQFGTFGMKSFWKFLNIFHGQVKNSYFRNILRIVSFALQSHFTSLICCWILCRKVWTCYELH